ncbi:MAG: hypothetical protein RI560_11215 [Natronomonas sp.]|nr:hypothetical protein [Natronomonas sp.]
MKEYLESSKVQLGALGVGAVLVWAALTYWAFVGWGIWSAVGFALFAIVGVTAPWVFVRVMFTPFFKGLLGAAFAILAQLTFGAGALVRRDDGGYEWGKLREDADGLYTILKNGDRVPIDGKRSDLPTVAWAPLAVTEQKTERNMRRFTVDETFATERPDPATGGGESVKTPLRIADGGEVSGWHIDSSKLERWVHDAAGAELPRNGLRKALEEKGGTQELSQWWLTIMAGVLVVLGFVLGYGALAL